MTGLVAKAVVPAAIQSLPWKLIGWAALGFTLVTMLFALRMEQAQNAKLKLQIHECTIARQADQDAYRKAQADAAQANKAHVELENKLREQINEASRSGFVADRDRLRAQSGTHQGTPGRAAVPQVPHAAPGTPPEVVSLPPAELLRAQELELQLNALIDWVELQAKVKEPSK